MAGNNGSSNYTATTQIKATIQGTLIPKLTLGPVLEMDQVLNWNNFPLQYNFVKFGPNLT